jgi:hypothetical protein
MKLTKIEEAGSKYLGHSPDNRDALMLAVFNPTFVFETASRGTRLHRTAAMQNFVNG